MPRFEDELDSIKPEPRPTAASTVKPTTTTATVEDFDDQPKKTTQKATPADDSLDVEFGDQKMMAKGDGLNRIRADKTKVVRFAILPFIKPKSAKSHFVEGKDKKGTFRCLSKDGDPGYCCTKTSEDGQLHVVALALQYINADSKTGGYEKGTPIEWEIGYVDLSRSNYRSVSMLAPEESTVYDIDIVMSKKENGIGYEFTLKSPKARWAMNPQLKAEVEEAAQKFIKDGGKKLVGKLGKIATLMEWRVLLSGAAATAAAEASLEDVEDL